MARQQLDCQREWLYMGLERGVPEVLREIFDGPWEEVAKGRWSLPEHITLLETRALYRCLQRASSLGDAPGHHLVVLGDNLGCVLCVDRCRAKSFSPFVVIKTNAALVFLHNIRLHIRSERNASD